MSPGPIDSAAVKTALMDFPDPENIIVPLFYSGSPANALSSRYDNPRLDALLEQSERLALYKETLASQDDIEAGYTALLEARQQERDLSSRLLEQGSPGIIARFGASG